MTSRRIYLTQIALSFSLAMLITLLLILPALGANMHSAQQDDEPYRTEEFSISTPGELEVRTAGGHITVEGSDRSNVRVEMFVRKNGRNLSAEDTDLEDYDVDISASGNAVRAHAKRESGRGWFGGWNNNLSISFVVYAPHEMVTDLKTSGGHIEVAGLQGRQEIATSGGHLKLSDISGEVEARTSGGHIELDHLEGAISARTSGGHINASNSTGTIDLRTSGGHIGLENVSGQVAARTSGGSINADLGSIEELADLRTSGGNVSITIPDNIGIDLDLRGSHVTTKLSNFSGEVERDEIRGSLNGGGPKLAARTSGGVVSIRFQ